MMEEFDVGRVLASAAPPSEAVPPVADLPARARALGRRRRARRAVLTGGGTGVAVAAVVGVVVAAGAFGSGPSGAAGTQAGGGKTSVTGKPATKPALPPTSALTSTPATPAISATSPTGIVELGSAPGSKPSYPKVSDDSGADAKLTAALSAALPPKWQGEKLYRAAGTPGSYAAEYTFGAGQQESVLDVSATTVQSSGGTPTQCQENPQHCTTGTATLLGHHVTWQYVSGQGAPTFSVTDPQGKVSYSYMFSGGTGALLPGLDVIKDIGLNDQVASALLDGIAAVSGG